MKRVVSQLLRFALVVAFIVSLSAAALAQLNRSISYQGYLEQPNGTPLSDGQYTIVLRLFDSQTGGNLLWEETQTTGVSKGLFNVYLGAVQSLDLVDFSKQMYLETSLSGQPPFPRTQLAQVPYAIYAGRAGSAASLDSSATGFVRSVNGSQGNIVVKGQNGIVVNTNGDTISIQSTITFSAIQSLTSPQGTMQIAGESGPNTTIDVKDGAITTAKLADNSVTTAKIVDGAIVTNDIANGAITATKIATGVIPTTLPPSGPAGGDLIGTYPNPLLANSSVTTAKIADNSITTPKLTDGVVTTPKISDGAVTSLKLSTTGVSAGTYGDVVNIPRITVDPQGRVTGISNTSIANFPYIVGAGGDLTGTYPNPMIQTNAVTTSKILDLNVTTSKLADLSVTNPKIADNAVNSAKIQDFTITTLDIAPGVIPTTLPPSGPAGGDLLGSSYPNPVITTGAVTASKTAPMLGGRFIIGTGTGSSPAVGTIVAGTGMTVNYSNPNIILSTSTVINPGSANNQTLRWDAATATWLPNANVLAAANGSMQVGGPLTLLSGQADYNSSQVDVANGTNTYLQLGEAGSQNDWVYVRQIGGPNAIHLALDFHDDANDARFSIRSVGSSVSNPDPAPVTRLSLDQDGRFMINASSATVPFYFTASGVVDGAENPASTDAPSLYVYNTNNTSSAAHSTLLVRTAGSGGGNPFVSWDINGDVGYSMGVDNSDNKLKISRTWDFAVGTAGNALMAFDFATSSIEANAATVRMPNIPSSAGERFVVSNPATGALETRTVTNVVNTNGFTTTGRIPRYVGPNTLGNGSLDDDGSGTLSRNSNIGINPGVGNTIVTNGSINASGNGTFNGTFYVMGTSFLNGATTVNSTFKTNSNTILGDIPLHTVTINAGTVTAPNIPTNSTGTNFVVSNAGALQTRNDVVTAFAGGGTSGKTTRWVNATTIGNGSFDDNGAGTLSYPGSFSLNPGAGNSIISNGSLNMNGGGTFGGSVSVGTTLGVTATATFFGNTVLGDASNDVVTINAGTLNATNLPTGSNSGEFLVRSGTAVQTRTINNIPTGTGTAGRMTRWGAGNTLVDASLDDNGNGQYTRDGSIRLASNTSIVNIDDGLVVNGRDVFIGDAFGGSLSIREPGGNFNARVTSDNLGNANRDYIIPNSNVATTRFVVGDYTGIQNINSSVKIGGPLTLLAGTADYLATQVDPANTTNTYIALGEAGSVNDWVYLRQIGSANALHLALDFHDDANDARFSIRSIGSSLSSPDPAPVTRLALDQEGRFMINASSSNVPFYFTASGAMDGLETPASTDAASLYVLNSNNTNGNAHSLALIRTAGPNGGDPYISLDVAQESGWSLGVDNSDGNKFLIFDQWNFDGNRYLTFDRGTVTATIHVPTYINQFLNVTRYNSNEGGEIDIQTSKNTNAYWAIDEYSGTQESRLRIFPTSSSEGNGMIIEENDGHVGIGMADPNVKLDVYSTENNVFDLESNTNDINGMMRMFVPNANGFPQEFIVFNTNNIERGNITVNGNNLAFNNLSDHRLKTDLRSFDALSIISKVPVYDFKWMEDGVRNYGFMAHELQAAVPYLVTGEKDAVDANGKPKYQMVDYAKLTPILTKAIQEQQTKIDEQQARIEKLEALVKELLEKK